MPSPWGVKPLSIHRPRCHRPIPAVARGWVHSGHLHGVRGAYARWGSGVAGIQAGVGSSTVTGWGRGRGREGCTVSCTGPAGLTSLLVISFPVAISFTPLLCPSTRHLEIWYPPQPLTHPPTLPRSCPDPAYPFGCGVVT